MQFTMLDWCVFIGFIVFVVAFSIYKSREEETSEDYFLAGRKLTWWLIGISMIAANISTEHFVGMSGRGFELGLAIASYEWTAAVAIVLVAWFFLPRFLRAGIYTIPEYLEYRYSSTARGLMAFYMSVAYILVGLASVLYSGALGLQVVFGFPVVQGVWTIGLIAGVYTVYGGLKAVAWADLFCAIGLLAGGALLTFLGLQELGGGEGVLHGIAVLRQNAGSRLSTVQPWDHGEIPWVAVFIGGLWIPQLFYWGLNQFITQRALAARSLAEAQKGMLLTACLKLLIPFIIVVPGIIAFELYANEIPAADQAYPYLMRHILPAGLRGLMFAAIFGAVMSTLDSMLNSASTILTMDIYKRYINPQASSVSLVWMGRTLTAVFVVVGCLWAPLVAQIGGGSVFKYIQTVWGFITPGIVAAFLLGITVPRVPAPAALGAMLLSPAIYGWCLWALPDVAFLHHQAITFIAVTTYMVLVARHTPLEGESTQKPFSIPALSAAAGFIILAAPTFDLLSRSGVLSSPAAANALTLILLAVYAAGVTFVMRKPVPPMVLASQQEMLENRQSAAARTATFIAAVFGCAVLGLHLYLFASWVAPDSLTAARRALAVPGGETVNLQLVPLACAAAGTFLIGWLFFSLVRLPQVARAKMPVVQEIDLSFSRAAPWWGGAVIVIVAVLYYAFF